LLLHLMIAELSYNNDGAQFISCFNSELFSGIVKKVFTWVSFALLALSVIFNVSAYLTGAAAVFANWFSLSRTAGILLFYVIGAVVVFFGIKLVGLCEKIAVYAMVAVVGILLAATFLHGTEPLSFQSQGFSNALALFGMVSFSLSAVMSTPQVVKGLNKDATEIRKAIAAGLAINLALIFVITLMTLLGSGTEISEDGALVDLSRSLGGWVSVVGYIFTLLALATSFWANTLNLRDIIHEQTKLNEKLSWLIATLPCLLLALIGLSTFVGFTRFASLIQVVTGLAIIWAYHKSRNRTGTSDLCGSLGITVFQILVLIGSVLSTVGAVLPVK